MIGGDNPRQWDTREPNMTRARIWREKAEVACTKHRKALRQEFGKLALKHGILLSDARLMLMNGVQP